MSSGIQHLVQLLVIDVTDCLLSVLVLYVLVAVDRVGQVPCQHGADGLSPSKPFLDEHLQLLLIFHHLFFDLCTLGLLQAEDGVSKSVLEVARSFSV